MKIYISHSSQYDYINRLYDPIRKSSLYVQNEIILPHESNIENTKKIIANCDLVIAEVSVPTTGQGIELGWADDSRIPILCVYERGSKISYSLKFITDKFIEYENIQDMINKIKRYMEENLK